MRIQALCNAGILLEMDGARMLIDALEGGYPPYAGAADWVRALDADLLLFTHKHPDHFELRMTLDHLTTHPDCRVFAGPEVTAALSGAGARAQMVTFTPDLPVRLTPAITLTPLPTRHMGAEYRRKEHFSLLLQGERRVLVAGDAAPVHNNFEPGGAPIGGVDVLIAPYPYALYEPAQRLFGRALRAGTLVANHIPEPDAEHVRETLRALPAWARTYTTVVTEPKSSYDI